MANFGIVVRVFLGLEKPFQDAIATITRRMGEGMAKYVQEDVSALGAREQQRVGAARAGLTGRLVREGADRVMLTCVMLTCAVQVVTVQQYDEYCFFVAGLVGVGLSQLFGEASGRRRAWATFAHTPTLPPLAPTQCARGVRRLPRGGQLARWRCAQRLQQRPLPPSLLAPPTSIPAAESGLESEAYLHAEELSTHMGLLLQKTNIIRDYLVGGMLCGCGGLVRCQPYW